MTPPMGEEFNADYYSTAAQVIPVFYLVLLGLEYWRPRGSHQSAGGQALIMLAITGFVIVAEVVCITALEERAEPSQPASLAIIAAFTLPLVHVGLTVLGRSLPGLRQDIPWWQRFAALGVVTVGGVAITVGQFFGDPSDALVAGATYALLFTFLWGTFLSGRTADRAAKPPSADH